LSLLKLYIDENTHGGKFLYYIFDFPFLKPDEVEYSFVLDLMADMPFNDKIDQFCDYSTKTGMEGIISPSLLVSSSEIYNKYHM